MDKNIDYKYNEKELLKELQKYVDSTYGEHYAQGKIQTTEFIIDNGHGIGHTVGNIIKYAQRYGKKDGRNRKDILKVLHYALIMLYVHDLETTNNTKSENSDFITLAGNHAQTTFSFMNDNIYDNLETINISLKDSDILYHPV